MTTTLPLSQVTACMHRYGPHSVRHTAVTTGSYTLTGALLFAETSHPHNCTNMQELLCFIDLGRRSDLDHC